MKAALAFAIWLFASLDSATHGECYAHRVEREPAYANYWWACGHCDWRGKAYQATALIACSNSGKCVWVTDQPRNVDLGICERKKGTK